MTKLSIVIKEEAKVTTIKAEGLSSAELSGLVRHTIGIQSGEAIDRSFLEVCSAMDEVLPEVLPENTKLKDGKILYRTHLDCVKCGEIQPERYNAETNTYVKCHYCKEKNTLEPFAAKGEVPAMDSEGYYFRANSWYYGGEKF